MSTTLLTGYDTFLPYSKAGSALSIVEDTSTKISADSERGLQLANQLQTSLDVEEIFARFSDEIKPYLPHHSLAYKLEAFDDQQPMEFSLRKSALHRMNFQLSINNKNLGSLEISRKTRFTISEAKEAEHLISTLLYPLRNALMYQAAVNAAHKDALTGTGNRAAFDEALHRQTDISQRHDRTLGMIIIDIDHFKKINDGYGHAAGDLLLKTLAQTTNNTIRLSDQLFRYGGEEFVVLLPETSKTGVKQLAERIRKNIEKIDCVYKGKHIKMTASFGVATLKDKEDEKDFFIRADKALYKAKTEGRNCSRTAR